MECLDGMPPSVPEYHTLSDVDNNIAYYFIDSGIPSSSTSSLEENTLKQHMGQTLEAYVKVNVSLKSGGTSNTYVWYRVAQVPVSTILDQ